MIKMFNIFRRFSCCKIPSRAWESKIGRCRKCTREVANINEITYDKLIEKVTAKMSEIEASLGENLADSHKISEEQTLQMKEALEALTSQLETLKADLSEKVHSENVKCYRNVADLLKCVEDKVDGTLLIEKKVSSVHKRVTAVIVLTIINMLGLAALVLYELGIFQMLIG